MIQTVRRALGSLEEYSLVVVLFSMIILSVMQIIMRNFMGSSFIWIDEVLRISVLWICLLGSMIASKGNNHIAIDIASHYVPEKFNRLLLAFVGLFTATVCAVMAYESGLFVLDVYKYEADASVGSVPLWMFQTILPLAFTVISLRYFMFSLSAIANRLPDEKELAAQESSHG